MGDADREKKRKRDLAESDSEDVNSQDGGVGFGLHDETSMTTTMEALGALSTDQKLDIIIKKLFEMDSKFNTLNNRVQENHRKIFDMETHMEDLTATVTDLSAKVNKMEEMIEDQANRSRRNNVIFYGVPEGAEGREVGDCTKLIKTIMTKHMNMAEAGAWEIERAHRTPMGPPRQDGRVRPIHVKFLRYQNRVSLLKAAPKKLRDNEYKCGPVSARLFITDDVTPSVRQDRKKLVQLKNKVKEKFPNRKVFIPPSVPAVLLRENSMGKLARVALGTPLNTLD